MEQRIKHSEHVGGVLKTALSKIEASKKEKLSAPIHFVRRDTNKLPLRVAAKRRKLVARGSGVYEDECTGDIWYREGEYLVKQKVDINGIVESYLEQCQHA